MFYTVYQTTNLVNGKIYIGAHHTEDPNDQYLGSGSHFTLARKKYGSQAFKKEVLFVFDNPEEMLAKERELVTPEFVAREDTYNLHTGGAYTPHTNPSEEGRRRMGEASTRRKGWNHSEETKKRLREKKTGTKASEETKRKLSHYPRTESHRRKLSEAGKGRVWSEETLRKLSVASSGWLHSEESKIRMREAWQRRRAKAQESK